MYFSTLLNTSYTLAVARYPENIVVSQGAGVGTAPSNSGIGPKYQHTGWRGPRFKSQHPHNGSQTTVTPIPGEPTSPSDLHGHQTHRHAFRQNTHASKNKIINYFLNCQHALGPFVHFLDHRHTFWVETEAWWFLDLNLLPLIPQFSNPTSYIPLCRRKEPGG